MIDRTFNKEIQTHFHVDRNGVNQTLTSGAVSKISFNNKVVDKQGWFDATTNFRFTPLLSGWYFFSLSVSGTTAADESMQAIIFKNGSTLLAGNYNTYSLAGRTATSTASGLILLNGSTDYVEGMAYLPAGQTTLAGATHSTRFSGFRVGD